MMVMSACPRHDSQTNGSLHSSRKHAANGTSPTMQCLFHPVIDIKHLWNNYVPDIHCTCLGVEGRRDSNFWTWTIFVQCPLQSWMDSSVSVHAPCALHTAAGSVVGWLEECSIASFVSAVAKRWTHLDCSYWVPPEICFSSAIYWDFSWSDSFSIGHTSLLNLMHFIQRRYMIIHTTRYLPHCWSL